MFSNRSGHAWTWAGPLGLMVLSVIAMLVGNSWKVIDPHLFRFGVAVLIVAAVWYVAETMSLGATRIAAVAGLVAVVLMLIHIGETERLIAERRLFEVQRDSLEAELPSLHELVEEAIRNKEEEAEKEAAEAATAAEAVADAAETLEESIEQVSDASADVSTSPGEVVPDGQVSDLKVDVEEALDVLETAATEAAQSADEAREAVEAFESSIEELEDAEVETIEEPKSFVDRQQEANDFVAGCDGGDDSGSDICAPREARLKLAEAYLDELSVLADKSVEQTSAGAVNAARASTTELIDGLNEPVAVHRLVIDGADASIGDLLDGLLEDRVASRLGGWGWLVAAVTLIVVYRRIEVQNAKRYSGPVRIETGEEPGEDLQIAAQRLRMWMGAAELREPAPIPGGEAAKQVSSLVAAESTQGKAANAVLELLQATAFPRKGVTMSASLEKLSENGPHRLVTRVRDTRTHRLIFVQSFEGADTDALAADAAHFAAERLLGESRVTPRWSTWESGDGSGLRHYQTVLMANEGPGVGLDDAARLRHLRHAVSSSPRTGVALVALANELALQGKLVESLVYSLRATSAHPRMGVARYRAGVTAAMLASDLRQFDDAQSRRVHTDVIGLVKAEEPRFVTLLLSKHEEERKEGLLRFAELQLKRGWSGTNIARPWSGLVASGLRSLRQTERAYWLSLLRSRRRRVRLWAATSISLQLINVRLRKVVADRDCNCAITAVEDWRKQTSSRSNTDPIEQALDEVNSQVEKAEDEAIPLYDAACFFSEFSGHDTAKADEHLEQSASLLVRARMSRDGHTISSTWAAKDPDLERLRESGPKHWDGALAVLQELENWTKPEQSEEQE